VETLNRRVGKLALRCSAAGAELFVDGHSVGTSPLERTLRLGPGDHQVTGQRAQSLPYVSHIAIKATETTPLKVDFKTNRPLWKRGWFWGTLVGAAAIVAAGVGLGVGLGRPSPLNATQAVVQNGQGLTGP
jgi:hypothetical protein